VSAAVLTAVLALAAPIPRGAEASHWVGKTIFRAHQSVQLDTTNAAGQQIRIYPTYVTYRVVDDEGERVRVINAGRPGWFRKTDVVRAEDAVAHFTALIAREPNSPNWLLYRGSAYREIGRPADGIKDYDTLIAKFPTAGAAYVYWNNRGSLKVTAKQYDGAIADLTESLRLSPAYPLAIRNRGWAKLMKKDYDAAIADLDQAIARDPTAATAFVYRGQCREKKGEFATAGADLAEALRAEPLSALALNARAWFLATAPDAAMRDGPAALKLVAQACDLTDWRTGSYLDTLAASSAECGKFADAVDYAEAVLRDKKFMEDHGPEVRERLALYQQGKPYRQEKKK
jgi:tetratricopeptide (TPR) repeat protein